MVQNVSKVGIRTPAQIKSRRLPSELAHSTEMSECYHK